MDEQGFIVLERFLDESDTLALEQALEDYQRRQYQTGALQERPREVLFAQKVAERDPWVQAFAQRDAFVWLSTTFLGPDTDLYFNQLVSKNPGGSTPFSWHQDDAYGPVEPSPYLTVWIAITDTNEQNGCLWVLPKSHKQGRWEHWEGGFGLACHSLEAPDQGIPLPVAQGSLVVFWSTTVHKSGPNLSPSIRKAFILQFSPTGIRQKASGMTIRSHVPIARGGASVAERNG
jgi:phytanoyl-CoA hydroxylase